MVDFSQAAQDLTTNLPETQPLETYSDGLPPLHRTSVPPSVLRGGSFTETGEELFFVPLNPPQPTTSPPAEEVEPVGGCMIGNKPVGELKPTSQPFDEPMIGNKPEEPIPTSQPFDEPMIGNKPEEPIPTSQPFDEPMIGHKPEEPIPTSQPFDEPMIGNKPEEPIPTSQPLDEPMIGNKPEEPIPTSQPFDEPMIGNKPEEPIPPSLKPVEEPIPPSQKSVEEPIPPSQPVAPVSPIEARFCKICR